MIQPPMMDSTEEEEDGPSMGAAFVQMPGLTPTVQSWRPRQPSRVDFDYNQFKGLDPEIKSRVIEQEAEMNGIERPRGYTVSYHYNPRVEQHHFGRSHPMKPWRLQLTKQLVLSYGLEHAMDTYETTPASKRQLQVYHDREYLDFLET